MLQSEFEERYNGRVSAQYYSVVESVYVECTLNKDEFVKEFKTLEKKDTYKAMLRMIRDNDTLIKNKEERIGKLEGTITLLQNQLKEGNEVMRQRDISNGQFLVDMAEASYEAETKSALREKAVMLMGMKTYLKYRIRMGYPLSEDEKVEVLSYMDGE